MTAAFGRGEEALSGRTVTVGSVRFQFAEDEGLHVFFGLVQ
jgi:hypothetical protein